MLTDKRIDLPSENLLLKSIKKKFEEVTTATQKCFKCKMYCGHQNSEEILKLPRILQFCIRRFDSNGTKLNFKMKLPEILEMNEFVPKDE